jgi:hypothetical protein
MTVSGVLTGVVVPPVHVAIRSPRTMARIPTLLNVAAASFAPERECRSPREVTPSDRLLELFIALDVIWASPSGTHYPLGSRAEQEDAEVLRVFAEWNPVSAVTAAARELFHNPNPSASIAAWPMQHPVAASLLWWIALLMIFAPLASHLYRRRTTD